MTMVELARAVGTPIELCLPVGAILHLPGDDDAGTGVFVVRGVVQRNACAHHAVAKQDVQPAVVEVGSQLLLVASLTAHADSSATCRIELEPTVPLRHDTHTIARCLDVLHEVVDRAQWQARKRLLDATTYALVGIPCLTSREGCLELTEGDDFVAGIMWHLCMAFSIGCLHARTHHGVVQHAVQGLVHHLSELGRRQHVAHLGQRRNLSFHCVVDLHDGLLAVAQCLQGSLHRVLGLGSHQQLLDDGHHALGETIIDHTDRFLGQRDIGFEPTPLTQHFLGIDGLEVGFDEALLEVVDVLHNLNHCIVSPLSTSDGILVTCDTQLAHHTTHVALPARHAARLGQSLGQLLLQDGTAICHDADELFGSDLGIAYRRLEGIEGHGRRILGVGGRRIAHSPCQLDSFAEETAYVACIAACIVAFVHQQVRTFYHITHAGGLPVDLLAAHQLRIGQHQKVVTLRQPARLMELRHLVLRRQGIHHLTLGIGHLRLMVGVEDKGAQCPAPDVIQVTIHIRKEQRTFGHIDGDPAFSQRPLDQSRQLTPLAHACHVAQDEAASPPHLEDGHRHAIDLLGTQYALHLVDGGIAKLLAHPTVHRPLLLLNLLEHILYSSGHAHRNHRSDAPACTIWLIGHRVGHLHLLHLVVFWLHSVVVLWVLVNRFFVHAAKISPGCYQHWYTSVNLS